ncbi:hypothetical protein [Snodgrassella alvi]|uniref:hypothetical protein n=1 Tax=Snodgrassella alvi TaxID=1196083 RepID=UPI003CC81144
MALKLVLSIDDVMIAFADHDAQKRADQCDLVRDQFQRSTMDDSQGEDEAP